MMVQAILVKSRQCFCHPIAPHYPTYGPKCENQNVLSEKSIGAGSILGGKWHFRTLENYY